jgi:tRNA A-37 threonylcarbamoyl transferase component Bud32
LLRTFFDAAIEPPLVPLLRHLCRELRVRFCRVNEMGLEPLNGSNEPASAFLGAGGSARVFCVATEGATEHFALKVSTKLSRSDLEYEFSVLQKAADAGAPVVPVVPKSLIIFVDATGKHSGGGFLLRDVCARSVPDTAARCTAAFEALRALHVAGFAHGDARLPNLLASRTEGSAKLLWIDLREAAADGLAAAQRSDARALAASILRAAQEVALSTRIEEKLANVPDGGDAAYTALAATVWATLMESVP